MQSDLAPIALSTYSRLGHLKQTVEALQKNELASGSELHIFSDAPKEKDREKVQAVRDYLKTIDGFKKVHIYEREENGRVENNRGGMRMLFEKHESLIFLEEDVITEPGFLSYMNWALSLYEDNDVVTSVCAYHPDFPITESYDGDVFIMPRFYAWGFGLWKSTFEGFLSNTHAEYEKIYINSSQWKILGNKCGLDVIDNIECDFKGVLDALDMKATFWQFSHNKYSLYPIKPLAVSIGNDGTGLHMGMTSKWDVKTSNKNYFYAPSVLLPNDLIISSHARFHEKCSMHEKIILIARNFGVVSELKFFKRFLVKVSRIIFFNR